MLLNTCRNLFLLFFECFLLDIHPMADVRADLLVIGDDSLGATRLSFQSLHLSSAHFLHLKLTNLSTVIHTGSANTSDTNIL